MKFVLNFILLAFSFSALGQETPSDSVLQSLVGKCGSEIPWITGDHPSVLDEAMKKAFETQHLILWYVPHIKGKHLENHAWLDQYMMTGVFTDEDVVQLIRRKFVPVKYVSKGDKGVKTLSFMEPCLIFMDPGGTIVHKVDRIRTLNTEFFIHVLTSVLKANPKFNVVPNGAARTPLSSLQVAGELIADANYEGAERTLRGAISSFQGEDQARAYLLLSKVYRRWRRAEEGMAALTKIKALSKDKRILSDAAAEEALLWLKQGKLTEARKAYEQILKDFLEGSRLDEAMYYLGAVDFFSGREQEAYAIWKKLSASKPDSRWAWMAAANIPGSGKYGPHGAAGPLVHGYHEISWLPEGAYGKMPAGTDWTQSTEDVLVRRSVEYLLRMQRSHGGWEDARYVFTGIEILPNVWTSVSALCCAALLEYRELDPARIDRALEKGEAYFLSDDNLAADKDELCYADAYRLLYLAKRTGRSGGADKEKYINQMNRVIGRLRSQQQKGGEWRHEYPNPFTTAVVVHALDAARRAGATVPAEVFKTAATGLKRNRSKDGIFNYSGEERNAKVQGGAGRTPLCEMALVLCGESSPGALQKSLEQLLANLSHLETIRKSDNHADEFRNGGFYFFHDIYPASEAVKLLPDAARKKFQAEFLKLLLRIPEVDGTFIDSHEMGKSYASAMALLTLKNCR